MCVQSGTCGPDFREAETPRTRNSKTRLGRRVCIVRLPESSNSLATPSFPETANFRKPRFLPRAKCAPGKVLPGGLRCNPGGNMRPIFAVLPALPGFPSPQPRAPWPVWRGSVAGPVRFVPISQKTAARLWHAARRWDRETRQLGQHGGIIGRTALAVLYVLVLAFQNFRTGGLAPSLDAIATKSGCCRCAVVDALARLRNLGLLVWQRRCEETRDADGRFRLRQRTNVYGLLPPSSWRGYRDDAPPPPDPVTLGAPERIPDGDRGRRRGAYQRPAQGGC